MRQTVGLVSVLTLVCSSGLAQPNPVAVSVDTHSQRQTFRGWSCNPHFIDGPAEQREQVIQDAVETLGITRLRWQQPNGNRADMQRWEDENDNGDPEATDMRRFSTAGPARYVEAYVLPFKRRVEAGGDPFEIWLSPSFFRSGSTGEAPAYLLYSPGEYAEFATSFILWLRDRYGLTVQHYAICNEAGNNNSFSPAIVIENTKVLRARLAALGLPTRGQFSDGVNAGVSWRYIQAAQNAPDIWQYVDVLSYHWYGRDNQSSMAKIRAFADTKGKDTAQTEFMHLTIDHLYDDLTIGGVSYWSMYGLGGPGPGGQNYWFRPDGTSFRRGRHFWTLRQVMRYVRPGDVRVDTLVNAPAIRALAFVKPDGTATAVLINTRQPQQARQVALAGLPAGMYGVCQSLGGKPYEEVGVQTARPGEALPLALPANAVVTVYPYAGNNLPPVLTDWEAQPSFLKSPASKVRLSARAQDAELATLSCIWAVTGHPDGATPTLATPNAFRTDATGLTEPGLYSFSVRIGDGKAEAVRTVHVNVFTGNQPPRLLDVHNRLPVQVVLPQSETQLRAGALDLENDPLTLDYALVSQPQGSAARVETLGKGKWKLANITMPGAHVVRCTVTDGTNTLHKDLTIKVYPQNHPPVIAGISAQPAQLAPGVSQAALQATTNDPDGDCLSHWWRVLRAPPDAKPSFASPGAANTTVSGLSAVGTYDFQLTVVDHTLHTQKAVRIVSGAPHVPAAGKAAQPVHVRGDPPPPTPGDETVHARGTLEGTVTAKGRAWIEIRSPSGKVTRYIPRWIGGMPRDGGGPDKQTIRQIQSFRTGTPISIDWYVDDHVRIKNLSQP